MIYSVKNQLKTLKAGALAVATMVTVGSLS
ncbi:hypothetical protein J2Z50_006419 [Ensifer mexicanus]|nr:hypothetical protein [Sinorhizobium mexicanum]